MRVPATHRHWVPLVLVVGTALSVLAGARAEAQPDPLWEHYKVYQVTPPPTGAFTVILRDQWYQATHQVQVMQRFMNPVQKRLPDGTTFGINDPRTHYSWWTISPHSVAQSVVFSNQFANQQSLIIGLPAFLLNPALKNAPVPPGPLPIENHYKCYDCNGQTINQPVTLIDAKDTWQTTVMFPRFWCNPTVKEIPGVATFPIIDENLHYVCYEFNPVDPNIFPSLVTDQFVQNRQVELGNARFLCVPTEKLGITPTQMDTWGKLKMLYR